jgi:SAM-dependent methyltransferase
MNYDQQAQHWHKKTQSGKHLSHIYLEKPAIYSLLPKSLKNHNILDLGCGNAFEFDHFLSLGAIQSSLVGVDNSRGLIEIAKHTYPESQFLCQDMIKVDFPKNSFDIIFSSLAFHYILDWQAFLTKLKSFLKSGGQIIFSTHHPIKWGCQTQRNSDFNEFKMGYKKFKKIDKWEIYGNYLKPAKIQDKLFNSIQITYYNRSLSQMFLEIKGAGFVIGDFLEPSPVPETAHKYPDFYQVYSQIPLFCVFRLIPF